jgi:hypothetical protein
VSPTLGRSLRRVVAGPLVGTAVAGLALSGCGVADDSLRPGLAAQVGDTGIALDRVDDAAADLCDMITYLSETGSATAVPGAVVRDNTLQYVVLRELGEQLAEQYDVEPGDLYRGSLKQNKSQLAELGVEGNMLDDVVPTLSSGDYFLDVAQQIGREELGLSADEDVQSEGIAEGLRMAQAWEAEEGLEVNPRFSDMSIGDLDVIVESELGDLSVPVSDFAKQALEGVDPEDPNSAYADSLPESQRCG